LAAGSLALVASCDVESAPAPTSVQAGKQNYGRTCALCHGDNAQGYAADNATALANQTFLSTASDEFLRRSIARGRPGTTMSAWHRTSSGPYDDDAIVGITAYLRSLQTVPNVELGSAPVQGNAAEGALVYAAKCASCHGAKGTEGPNVRLANAEFLSVASDAFLRHAIVNGRPGTSMKGYGAELLPGTINDLVALLRSWATPVSSTVVPAPTLGPVVQNPNGPEPAFTLGQRFTPADVIKKELDRGAAMGFLDARAPSDYVAGHITGAVSVPFYDALKYASALPKDKWLISYCGCPHAASGQLMDALVQAGFTKITILDEGYGVWRDRGYPVREGGAP
jgi:cytochrome c oxidase cbb3-type subunit 3/ubiquinol-cytochrome c reductase cytochrome c subunit